MHYTRQAGLDSRGYGYRHRREDIPLLVAHILARLSAESGTRNIYAPEAVELLATAEHFIDPRLLERPARPRPAVERRANRCAQPAAADLNQV